ncbi:MAG: hypothetical protein A4E52_01587 [Pelotomaculum sp. PtaB.Bin013]|uniref:Exoribonuclease R n=1 Tax=Pelotomaculum isophthalicicum JI TaxID=947010 RepID=A0A9X4H6N6_9FIRM|nr:exoribonuclease R [Pelotomaculum isophthalicicum]MDF9407069.1 exoribonuclease R [Pelotomaculum isophthalicicum JI]OPX85829.1 MAG: hypothetical protein A4E52_01587 [Pelotomaculum sp. PtaB.Bin013]
MLTEIKFTNARKTFTDIYDNVWHRHLPVIINRHQNEEVLLLRRELQQDILKAYHLKPEILPEKDGSVTVALNEIDIAVNEPTLKKAIDELIKEMKIYAQDYIDRSQLFLNAPNRKGHFPYILRVLLCDNDQEIKSLLEL